MLTIIFLLFTFLLFSAFPVCLVLTSLSLTRKQNYSRSGVDNSISKNRGILREARFYNIGGLIKFISKKVNDATSKERSKLTDEKVYKLVPQVSDDKLEEVLRYVVCTFCV